MPAVSQETEKGLSLMNGLDKLVLKASLETSSCMLNHEKPRKAVNYLCQGFGGYELVVPICQECEDKMCDPDWVLLFCTNCCKSCWIYKPESKRQYHYKDGESLKWMSACPYCNTNELLS